MSQRPKQVVVRFGVAFGREVLYPVCETSKVFARLARGTTLTRNDLMLIAWLGYEIIAENPFTPLDDPNTTQVRAPWDYEKLSVPDDSNGP